MRKKVVFLPYDFDTAIGINNEGSLVFDYSLEDTDHLEGGADVFNGQQSVLWNNLREMFLDEIRNMYQTLRSDGTLSYQTVEQMFEDHQDKWPEAIFNEDSWFKYIDPLTKDGDETYLPMAQGSKAEQRKWWLYNRFRYIDSKYNAGDALSDYIQVRGYAKDNITITPYADIYPTIRYGSYLVSERGKRNVSTTLINPLSNVNDTEIYIYSASQLSSVGDLSGLKVGLADFSRATRLQSIKVGDSSSEYTNPNLKSFSVGNNPLLASVDVRNCTALASAIDLSGCSNIEHVYFDGTAITACALPNGGILKTLHLPATVTNLTIMNQPSITDFTMAGYSNITTLRLENVSNAVDIDGILDFISAGCRVRLIGISMTMATVADIVDFYDDLDTMRGLDENGNNLEHAVVSGTIFVDNLTGAQLASLMERQPNITIRYNHITSNLYYYNWEGDTLLNTEVITDGGDGTYNGTPSHAQTAQYTFAFAGWSKTKESGTADPNALKNVTADRAVYAAYTLTTRKYTATFKNDDNSTILQTINDIPYGTTPSYTGTIPTSTKSEYSGQPFEGWSPQLGPITGNTTYVAVYQSPIEDVEITDDWDTIVRKLENGLASDYKIGNYKPLDLGSEGTINMQIVAIDADTTAAGDAVPVTFIGKELIKTGKPIHIGSLSGGYANSNSMRPYLNDTLITSVSSNVRNAITPVLKTSLDSVSPFDTLSSIEKIWIPSLREVVGPVNSAESSGPFYTQVYGEEATKRIKHRVETTSATFWWTRTTYKGIENSYRFIKKDGYSQDNLYNTSLGICPSFCLGAGTIGDSWETISQSIANGTYKTDYSIGDTKLLDLGSEGKILMQIVAFDADTDENGNSVPITWIAKQLLVSQKKMQSENTNIGNFSSTIVYSFINDLKSIFPETLKNMIVPVVKYSLANGNEYSEILEIWVPSMRELVYDLTTYEKHGPQYGEIYRYNNKLTGKVRYGTIEGINDYPYERWWTRTSHIDYNSTRYTVINRTNNTTRIETTSNMPATDCGICIGFCTGAASTT